MIAEQTPVSRTATRLIAVLFTVWLRFMTDAVQHFFLFLQNIFQKMIRLPSRCNHCNFMYLHSFLFSRMTSDISLSYTEMSQFDKITMTGLNVFVFFFMERAFLSTRYHLYCPVECFI